jgi:hypothetical protein
MSDDIALRQIDGFGDSKSFRLILAEKRQPWKVGPSNDHLAGTVDGKAGTYWYLHGFRTGRGDETHQPPPIWQWTDWRTWRRGMREGSHWIG